MLSCRISLLPAVFLATISVAVAVAVARNGSFHDGALIAPLIQLNKISRRPNCNPSDTISCEPEIDPVGPGIPRPSPSPSPWPIPTGPGSFGIQTKGLKIISEEDGFLSGCADPWTYVLYGRVIPGTYKSTFVKNLGRIDWGNGRCRNKYIRKTAGIVRDLIPPGKVALSIYIVIAIEEDSAGTKEVDREVRRQFNSFDNTMRELESAESISPLEATVALSFPQIIDDKLNLTAIEELEKPVDDGFLSLGHDFVGINALVLFSGTLFEKGQPTSCNRERFPICAVHKDGLSTGIVVGGKIDSNKWRMDVELKMKR